MDHDTTPMRRAEALIRLAQSLKSFDHIAGEMVDMQRRTESVMAEVLRQMKAIEQALECLESVRRDVEALREAQAQATAAARAWHGRIQQEIADAVAVLAGESQERWSRLRREGYL